MFVNWRSKLAARNFATMQAQVGSWFLGQLVMLLWLASTAGPGSVAATTALRIPMLNATS